MIEITTTQTRQRMLLVTLSVCKYEWGSIVWYCSVHVRTLLVVACWGWYAFVYTFMNVPKQLCTPTCLHSVQVNMHSNTCLPSYLHAYLRTCMGAWVHTRIWMRPCVCPCVGRHLSCCLSFVRCCRCCQCSRCCLHFAMVSSSMIDFDWLANIHIHTYPYTNQQTNLPTPTRLDPRWPTRTDQWLK